MNITDIKLMLLDQWQYMLNRGTIPIMEYDHGNNQFTTVDIQLEYGPKSVGILFEIDSDIKMQPYFSGDIKRKGGCYYLPADIYTLSLDSMLEQIGNELTEGLFIPNDVAEF